jgi:UDP-3-O-[3-hydroxymyristoyl] glucosamine N-acyltransferase
MNDLTLEKIASITGGELTGDGEIVIRAANTLQDASEGEITFFSNPKYTKWLEDTSASCILISADMKPGIDIPVIRVDDPDIAFSVVLKHLYPEKRLTFEGISETASIGSDVEMGAGAVIGDFVSICSGAVIGEGTVLYPGVYVGPGARIGNKCSVYPGAVIENSVIIGDNVIVHSGAVIGGDGFGYVTVGAAHRKIPQVGSVIIESDVEIGANTCIDRGSPGNTIVGKGTKIDNLVQIAHNVRIGRNCFICAQVGIAGSTIIKDYVVLAGQAGLVGHITIGDATKVGAQAGVTRDIKPGKIVSGYPAFDHTKAMKINALIKKLPKLFKEVEKISKIIKDNDS